MKVLMFSTDASILREGSDARSRMLEYGALFEELHIVVLNQKSEVRNQKFGHVHFYATNSRWKLLWFWNAYHIGASVIRNWKLEIRYCALSAQDPFETGLIGYLLKKKFGIPLQLQVHTDFLSPYFRRESFKNKIRVLLGKWLLKKADGIRVVSERIKKSLIAKRVAQSVPIAVLPIFVDVEKIRTAPVVADLHKTYPQFSFIMLMAARLTREKHIGLALRAMREVIKTYPHAGLMVVGEGPQREALQLQATNYKLQENVIFEDWTNELASYYKTADLFLLTSNYEGYGRTVVEAAAAGLPTVMTDVGLAGEFLADNFNGRVVPVGDASAIAGAVVALIGNPEQRQTLAKNAFAAAQQLGSKAAYLTRYCDILKEISHEPR